MKYEAKVTRVVQETPTVKTIFFTVEGSVLPFTAGQYVTVSFTEGDTKTGKAYSLSSAPQDPEMSITVKHIGAFSGRLSALRVGDSFLVSKPYGFFNVQSDAPITALVAGVGISPVWSIIRDELHHSPERPVRLLCSASCADELVFKDAIQELEQKHPSFVAQRFTTQSTAENTLSRRMEVHEDVSDEELERSTFYVCGSQNYVSSLWRQLIDHGVDESRVVTETFFEANA